MKLCLFLASVLLFLHCSTAVPAVTQNVQFAYNSFKEALLSAKPEELDGTFDITDSCAVNLDHNSASCESAATTIPEGCLSIAHMIPGNTVPGLEKFASSFKINSATINTCQKTLAFSTAMVPGEEMDIIPSVLQVFDFTVNVNYDHNASPKVTGEVEGSFMVGQMKFSVKVIKSADGYTVDGHPQLKSLSVSDILRKLGSNMFPEDDLTDAFNAVGLSSVSISEPKFHAVMPSDGTVGMQFTFKVNIPNFGSTMVYLTYNKLSSTDKGIYLALGFPTVTLPNVVARLTNDQVDISNVPFLGTAQVSNPGLVFASKNMSSLIIPFPDPSLSLLETLQYGVTVAFSAEVSGDNPANFVLTYTPRIKRLDFNLRGLKPKVSSLLKQMTSKIGSVEMPPKFNIDDFLGKALEFLAIEGKVVTIPVPLGSDIPLISNSVVLQNPELTFEIMIGSANLGVQFKTGLQIGSVHVSLEISKPQGSNTFVAHGKSDVEIPIGGIIAKFGKAILPIGPLKDAIDKAGFEKFKIVRPEVSIMFGSKEYAMRVQGTAMIGNMEASTVEVLLGQQSGALVMSTGVILQKTPITQVIKTVTANKVDLSIVPGSKILDNTRLALVIASNPIPEGHEVLAFTVDPLSLMQVDQGLGVIAHFSLPENCGSDVGCKFLSDHVLKAFPSLIIRGSITASQLTVEAVLGDSLDLVSGLSLTDLGLKIEVGKARTAVGVQCSLEVANFPPKFTGELGISTSGAFVAVSFTNWWKKAFGLDFLSLGNMQLRVAGFTDPLLINELELGGQMRLGFEGRQGVTPIEATIYGGISRVNPQQNYIYAKVSALTMSAIANAFAFKLNMPKPIATTGFPEGVTVSYSQIERTVSDVTIPQGFYLKGMLQLAYIGKFYCDLAVSTSGIKIDLNATRMSIAGGLVKINGVGANSMGPRLHVDLTWSPPKSLIEINGLVEVLGISRSVSVYIDHQKMYFSTSGKVLNLFEAEVSMSATYGNVRNMNFMVNARYKTDLIAKLRQMVQDAIKNFADHATREINKAKADVANAQRAMNKAADDLASKKRDVDRFQSQVGQASNVVNSKKADVDRAQRHFDNAIAELNKAKGSVTSFQRKVNDAANNVQRKKNDVDSAQRHFDNAVRTLESKKGDVSRAQSKFDDAIRALEREKSRFGRCRRRRSIDEDDDFDLDVFEDQLRARQFLKPKKRWGIRLPRIRIKSPAEIAREIGERGREVLCRGYKGVITAAQGVVNGAKHTLNVAKVALSAAQGVVNGARVSLDAAKVALDVAAAAVRGFEKSLEAAKLSLTVAQKTVDASRGSLEVAKFALTTAVGAMKGFQQSLEVAEAALPVLAAAVRGASSTLNGVKATLEAVNQAQKLGAKAASLIAGGLLGGIIDIREMSSRVELSAMQGGSFTGSISVTFFDGPVQKYSFTISLPSPQQMANFLIDKAKKALESLV